MRVRIDCLPEPELAFGRGFSGVQPKESLKAGGPIDSTAPDNIHIGLVALDSDIEEAATWIHSLNNMLLSTEKNARRFRHYPGAEKAFHSRFVVDTKFCRAIDTALFEKILELPQHQHFNEFLEIFESRITSLIGDQRPDCIVVCLPESLATLRIANPRLTETERSALHRIQAEEDEFQLELFQPTPEEMAVAARLRPQAEELLFRNFYRALKARTMSANNALPIQVMRRHTFVEEEASQSAGTRAWNLAAALFYKSGHIPWSPANLDPNTCFVGITFHHLKQRGGDIVYASVAQAFSNEIEPFALRGAIIPPDQRRNRQPYLQQEQAAELISRVIDAYEVQAGIRPARVVVHKTTRYQAEEQSGFEEGSLEKVSGCELIWLTETPMRILRKGMQEPWRGTLCTIGDDEHYIFTTGYVPYWDEYPGPHIPAPLRIGSAGPTDIAKRAGEILALTKMNWNSCEGLGRYPVTLSFAKKVGTILTELASIDSVPNPSYRFYM